jgi:hypothetical protein
MVFNTFLIISYKFFSSTTRGYPFACWLAIFFTIQEPLHVATTVVACIK